MKIIVEIDIKKIYDANEKKFIKPTEEQIEDPNFNKSINYLSKQVCKQMDRAMRDQKIITKSTYKIFV